MLKLVFRTMKSVSRKFSVFFFFSFLAVLFSGFFFFSGFSSQMVVQTEAVASDQTSHPGQVSEKESHTFEESDEVDDLSLLDGRINEILSPILLNALEDISLVEGDETVEYKFRTLTFEWARFYLLEGIQKTLLGDQSLLENTKINLSDISEQFQPDNSVWQFLRDLIQKNNVNPDLLAIWKQQKVAAEEKFLNSIRSLLLKFQALGLKDYNFAHLVKVDEDMFIDLDLSHVDNLATVSFAQLPVQTKVQLRTFFLVLKGNPEYTGGALELWISAEFDEVLLGIRALRALDKMKYFVDNADDFPKLEFLVNASKNPRDWRWFTRLSQSDFLTVLQTGKEILPVFHFVLNVYKEKMLFRHLRQMHLNQVKHFKFDRRLTDGSVVTEGLDVDELLSLPNLLVNFGEMSLGAKRQLVNMLFNGVVSSDLEPAVDRVFPTEYQFKTRWELNYKNLFRSEIFNDVRHYFVRWQKIVLETDVEPIDLPKFLLDVPNLATVEFLDLDQRVKNWFGSVVKYADSLFNLEMILYNEYLNVFAFAIEDELKQLRQAKPTVERIVIGKDVVREYWYQPKNNCWWWQFWCTKPKRILKKKILYRGKVYYLHNLFNAAEAGVSHGFYHRMNKEALDELKYLTSGWLTVEKFFLAMPRQVDGPWWL